jgi:hypothetical protein
MMDSSWSKTTLRDLETPAFAKQHVGCRHSNVLEKNLAVSVWRIVIAKDRQHSPDCYSGQIHRYEYHGLLFVNRRRRVGLSHEDGNLASRIARTGRPPFQSVDYVAVSGAFDPRLDVGRIRRRYVGLGHREA